MGRLRFCTDIDAREPHILDRSDWERAPGRHSNCVNTIVELLRVLFFHCKEVDEILVRDPADVAMAHTFSNVIIVSSY